MTTGDISESHALARGGLVDTTLDAFVYKLRRVSYQRRLWLVLRSPMVVAAVDTVAVLGALVVGGHLDAVSFPFIFGLPIWLALVGSYRKRIAPSLHLDFAPLLGALATPALVLAFFSSPSAVHLFHQLPLVAGLVLAGRLVSYTILRLARIRSTWAEPTLIVGSGILGCQVARILLDHPEYGLQPVGFIDGFPDEGHLPVPLVGNIDHFDGAVRQTGARRVIVAFGANREPELVDVLRASAEARVEVHVLPRLFELGVTPSGPEADIIWGLPLHRVRRAALRSPAWRTKRALDVMLSGTALLLSLPVLLLSALAVRCTSNGPVLFRQRRVGQRGETVDIYKFRSMRVNAESDVRWGSKADDRITPVGRVLRATSIDELPQLINVLKGQMSMVGPRPERPLFADQFDVQVYHYKDRLRVPVGLTGWAQVHGLRGDTSIEERARFDNYYIEHWSLWFDLVILTRTVGQVLREVGSHLHRAGHHLPGVAPGRGRPVS